MIAPAIIVFCQMVHLLPPVEENYSRFPPKQRCDDMAFLAQRYERGLMDEAQTLGYARGQCIDDKFTLIWLGGGEHAQRLAAAIEDSHWRWLIWHRAAWMQVKGVEPTVREWSAKDLRKLIGDKAWVTGQMPSP